MLPRILTYLWITFRNNHLTFRLTSCVNKIPIILIIWNKIGRTVFLVIVREIAIICDHNKWCTWFTTNIPNCWNIKQPITIHTACGKSAAHWNMLFSFVVIKQQFLFHCSHWCFIFIPIARKHILSPSKAHPFYIKFSVQALSTINDFWNTISCSCISNLLL